MMQRKVRNCNTHRWYKSSVTLGLIGVLMLVWHSASGEELIDESGIEKFWASMPQHRFFTTQDGVRIAYRSFIHPKPKALVVIVSGRTETFLKYQELIFDLYQRGYSVFQHDHRGQGLSGRLLDDPLKGHVENFGDYVTDLHQFMNQVVQPTGAGPYLLLSHSLGGAVAIRYMAQYPKDFAAAVLGSPMLAPNTGPAGTCLLASLIGKACGDCSTPSSKPETFEERFAQNRLTHSKQRFRVKEDIFHETPAAAIAAPTFGWVEQACAIRRDLLDDASKLETPIMLLQAGADTVVLNEPQDEFCRRLNRMGKPACQGGKPHVIPNAFHELYFEADEYRTPALQATYDFFERYGRVPR